MDVALYGGAGADNLEDIGRLARQGAVAYKTFTMPPVPGREAEFYGLCSETQDALCAVMERVASQGTPVIFLSAMQQVADKVRGLHLGAEDYIAKPFEALELLARVEVALRRRGKGREVLEYGDIRQDLGSHTVTLAGEPVALSAKEFELLRVFLQNRDLALSRAKLLALVWGYEFEGESRTVDIHVQRLRQKLDLSQRLVTLPRIGYRLEKLP